MMVLALALSATMSAAAPAAHEVVLEHRGTTYQLRYSPHVTTKMKTVGVSAGSRPSTERCRWTMALKVERQVSRAGTAASLDKMLPAEHVVEGSRPGNCMQVRKALDTELAAKAEGMQDRLVAAAQADRPIVMAEIDSTRALALN